MEPSRLRTASTETKRRLLVPLTVVLICAACSGCATGGYFEDRANDAADIFTATIGQGGGMRVRVGPVHVGALVELRYMGLRNGEFDGDGNHGVPLDMELLCLPLPGGPRNDSFFSAEMTQMGEDREKAYAVVGRLPFVTTGPLYPDEAVTIPSHFWTQIDLYLGLYYSVRLGFNPGEMVDFVLGWTTIDIYADDLHANETNKKMEQKAQAGGVTAP
jgi:hypothetical protein